MNRIKLAVLSLLALAFACPIGFRTANADAPTAERALEDFTVPELREVAAQYNVEITSSMNKADIVAAIKASTGYKPPTQSLADRVEDAVLGKPVADTRPAEVQLAEMRAEIAALRNAVPGVAAPVTSTVGGTLALLVQGAGVKVDDVTWRIRAGLTEGQAVEVALQEKNERERAAKEAKK